MQSQNNEQQGAEYSPVCIRATWDGTGTGSVADASRALGFSRAKGYTLVRRGGPGVLAVARQMAAPPRHRRVSGRGAEPVWCRPRAKVENGRGGDQGIDISVTHAPRVRSSS